MDTIRDLQSGNKMQISLIASGWLVELLGKDGKRIEKAIFSINDKDSALRLYHTFD